MSKLRPGVKFKDPDLIGVPHRVTIGKRKVEQGLAEVLDRSTKQMRDVNLREVAPALEAEYLARRAARRSAGVVP